MTGSIHHEPRHDQSMAARAEAGRPEEVMMSTARILVVDDEAPLMRVLCDTLSGEGYETTGCTSAEQALGILQAPGRPVDLLLTDLMMPGMDGIALLREAGRRDPLVVGVMMTGVGTIGTAVEAMKAGALDYILKPFRLFEALPVINRALSVRQLRIDKLVLERQVRAHAQELEFKNQELEAFSYSVSHDLRAPLRRIDQFANILLTDHGTALPADGQRLLGRITANTALMATLIDDLLALSQVSKQDLRLEPVDLSQEAQQVLDTLQANEPHRRVATSIRPGITWMADRGLAHIVLENLIGNAWKYSAKVAEARIEIDTLQEQPETWYVRDNGAGFDMKQAGRLFLPFQRMHRPDDFPGTGIGLSIVARIVARHGARIRAESQPGRGTTMFVTMATQAAGTSPAANPSPQHGCSPTTPLQQKEQS